MPIEACLSFGSAGISLTLCGLPESVAKHIITFSGTGHGASIMVLHDQVIRFFIHRIGVVRIIPGAGSFFIPGAGGAPRQCAPRRVYIEKEQCAMLLLN